MMWKWALLAVGLLLVGLACAEASTPTTPTLSFEERQRPIRSPDDLPASNGASTGNLSLTEFDWEAGEFGTRYLVGIVVNNTDETYSYVQISINLYDRSGAQVGSTLDNVNNLEPGGRWRFKAFVLEDDVTEARVKEITGF